MRILFCSYAFAPSIGGIETVSRILANQFCGLGSTVTLVTNTPGEEISGTYEVVRRPTIKKLRELARNSDVIFQNNISLKTLLPLLFLGKPVVITHQTWLTRTTGQLGWQDYLKRALLSRWSNIAISQAVAADLPVKSIVIGNPFEPGEFAAAEEHVRNKDIVFLGRLVSDKGCDLVLRALSILKTAGICPSFTVIGDGPEMPALKQLTAELGLSDQVMFLGAVSEGRGKVVAEHNIMVIPSIWKEPFGVAALEGIAAGCAVVASRTGGLPEAIGPCGILFPGGDVVALASALKELLASPSLRDKLAAERNHHLKRFHPEVVAKRYLEVFESAMRK
jgi:glycosyltransferase involved in cell wall biosynthesis